MTNQPQSTKKNQLLVAVERVGVKEAVQRIVAPETAGAYSRTYYLEQAATDVHEAWVAIQVGNWLRADIFLKLAIDQIKNSGILP